MSVKGSSNVPNSVNHFAIGTLALVLLLTSFGSNATSFSPNQMKAIYLLELLILSAGITRVR